MNFSAEQIARARTRHSLAGLIGRSVALHRRGGDVTGLCPFHKERTPSFHVEEAKGFYHCFGCGARGSAIDWLMQAEGLTFRDAVARLLDEEPEGDSVDGGLAHGRPTNPMRSTAEGEERSTANQHRAAALWREAVAIEGTAGEGYFRRRGIALTLPPSLRFLQRCRHPAGEWLPTVVCAVSIDPPPALAASPPTALAPGGKSRVIAVLRIYLDPDSIRAGTPSKTKLTPDKALLGSPGAGAIRLAPAAARLGLAEGVETGLAVMQATGLPVWSAITGGHLAALDLPELVAEPVILADRDPVVWQRRSPMYGRRPGEYYASLASQRFRREGRRPLIALPGQGGKTDFNDLLVGAA